MAKEFKLPELGENIEAGDVVSVLVKVGDIVEAEQAVLELETDKATVEVPSDVSGKISEIHVSEGDRVEVGQTILTVEEGEAEEAEEKEEEAAEEEPAEEEEAREEEGKKEKVEKADEKGPEKEEAEAEESKAEKAPRERPEAEEKQAKPEPKAVERGRGEVVSLQERKAELGTPAAVPASPAVRRFAREIGINIAEMKGSGPKGRISIDDVKAYSKELNQQPERRAARGAVQLPDFTRFGEVEREKFSNVRRATARHLAQAWEQVVHVTNHDRADVTQLEESRKRFAPQVEAAGGKLTVTAIIMKILASALNAFPKFNASLDMAAEEVVFKKYCHIGVAVDTERGLLVPVIRDVDRKSITELSVELKEVAERARQGKISLEEMQGGSMTVTNLGGIGGTSFTPVVNFPEVAILGISRTSVEPVFIDGSFQPRKILPLSLSYDHRLVDGADAARFLRWLVNALEDPLFVMIG